MKLALFGATGRTGRHLLAQALQQGHSVTALARDPRQLAWAETGRLQVVSGDVRDAAAVSATVAGAEAVLSVLGPTSNRPELAVSAGTDNLLAAMRQHGVRRLIQSTGAGVRDPQDQPTPIHAFFGALVRRLTPNVLADMTQTVDKIRASDLDWTLVRVPRLTDGAPTGHIRVAYVGPELGLQLTRADLAGFMLQQLADTRYLRQAPAISN
jgi:putative NADH-flavin reductase